MSDPGDAARRLEDDGWVLDAGQAHGGQGTRNRRLAWRAQFFELLWVTDAAEASANPLRLDRRADPTTTGASPLGLAFRGQVEPARSDEFWPYDALGPRISDGLIIRSRRAAARWRGAGEGRVGPGAD
ncbi:MAG: hypothetical protein QOG35_1745 [Solirubrobacteraceae bacterium]|nr:hypothetical protein [Solirubrobacteraceae bacterium]